MNSREYIGWIASQPHNGFSVTQENDDQIVIRSEKSEGEVLVYHLETDVVEMRLSDRATHENFFFLHFELKEEDHAHGLYREMIDTLKKHESRCTLHVLLSCTSGMTTGFFAEKLNEAAKTLSLDHEYSAVAFSSIHNAGFNADVILLAPQIAWQLKKVKEVFTDQLVITIPASVFASYDAGKVIALIHEERTKQKKTREQTAIAKVMRDIDTNAVLFAVNMTHDLNSTRYVQRLYEAGNVLLTEEVIKEQDSIQDIYDILDTALRAIRKNFHVDACAISLPGIVNYGNERERVDYENLSSQLSERYELPVYVHHNTAAVAYGYYAQQEKYDIVCYHSQVTGSLIGGTGSVYRGIPLDGRKQMGGELEPVFFHHWPERSEKKDSGTAEEIKEAVIFYLLMCIAEIAPEVILVRSALTPDMDELKEELKKYIDEKYIPDLIHVRDITEYALLGTMLYGMHALKQDTKKLMKKQEGK